MLPEPANVFASTLTAPPLPAPPADEQWVPDWKPRSPPSAINVPLIVTVPFAAITIAPPPPPPPPPAQPDVVVVDAPPPPPAPPMIGRRSLVAMNVPFPPAPADPAAVPAAPPPRPTPA